MNARRFAAAPLAAVIPLLLAIAGNGCSGCKKDEPPPPLPAAPQDSTPPPATVNLAPPAEDAGDDGGDADADAKHYGGKPADVTGLRNCCAALQANAASMPPPQNAYALAAAQYCSAVVSSVNTPGQKDALLAGIRNALHGATMPAACH